MEIPINLREHYVYGGSSSFSSTAGTSLYIAAYNNGMEVLAIAVFDKSYLAGKKLRYTRTTSGYSGSSQRYIYCEIVDGAYDYSSYVDFPPNQEKLVLGAGLLLLVEQVYADGTTLTKTTAPLDLSSSTEESVTIWWRIYGKYNSRSWGLTLTNIEILDESDNVVSTVSFSDYVNEGGSSQQRYGYFGYISITYLVNVIAHLPQLYSISSSSSSAYLAQYYAISEAISRLKIEQIYSIRESITLSQLYSISSSSSSTYLAQYYAISGAIVTEKTDQLYGLRMAVMFSQHYDDAHKLLHRLTQYYMDAVDIMIAMNQDYGDTLPISALSMQQYAIANALQKRLGQDYAVSGADMLSPVVQDYGIMDVDTAATSIIQPYAMLSGGLQAMSYQVSVIVGGAVVRISSLSIEASRDTYCLSCEIHLVSQADYARCRVMDDLVIAINGQEYRFFVEARQRRRGHEEAEYTIHGLSRTALLDEPYADPVTGELSGTASQIVAGLATGYSIDWRTVDWHIPPGTMMPGDQTPLQVIRQIVAAAGAVIQTDPDGTMVIEPAYPVPVTGWDTAAVQHTLSDADDFLSLAEEFDHRPGYNRFLVSDQLAASDSLRLEEEAVSASRKIIRAYQVPWEGDFGLRHTGGPWVAIEPLGIEERIIEDEVVEFVAGEGRTRYPIIERVAMAWLRADLGSVIFSEDGALLADVAGESLLRISYRTRCRKYLVTDTRVEQVQIVAEEVS